LAKFWRREHLEVVDVANLLAGVDIHPNHRHWVPNWGTLAHHLRFFAFAPSEIPTQVLVPSVSLAARPQGTALTVFVETPSGPTMFKPGPVFTSGNGPPKDSADGVADVAGAPVPDVAGA
jgi:hypothetical protein